MAKHFNKVFVLEGSVSVCNYTDRTWCSCLLVPSTFRRHMSSTTSLPFCYTRHRPSRDRRVDERWSHRAARDQHNQILQTTDSQLASSACDMTKRCEIGLLVTVIRKTTENSEIAMIFDITCKNFSLAPASHEKKML